LRLEHRLGRVERERALVLAVSVALGTTRLDERGDVVREVDFLSLWCIAGAGGRHRPSEQPQAHASLRRKGRPTSGGPRPWPPPLPCHRQTPRRLRLRGPAIHLGGRGWTRVCDDPPRD